MSHLITSSTAPKIAIIGAGPGGLTLANLLQKSNIPCAIYEGEPDRHSRNQGGSLDLHSDGGQLALAEAGLLDDFHRLSRPEGECLKLVAADGKIIFDENDPTQSHRRPEGMASRPEIDRTILRDLLLDALEPETVRWGHKVARIERHDPTSASDPTTYTIHFTSGATERDITLLIGADGAFSSVRPLCTPEKPFYAGITMITMWKPKAAATNPWLSEYVGRGSFFMFDEGRAVIAQRQQDGSVRTYAGLRKSLEWTKNPESGIDWEGETEKIREVVAEREFEGCTEEVKRLIKESDGKLEVRHLWMLPVGLKWESQAAVTLLGDAAHVMTPFAGVGVNVAMVDALMLARAIVKHRDVGDWNMAVSEYEEEMFVRAEKNAKKSYAGLKNHFQKGGSEEFYRTRLAPKLTEPHRE